MGAAPRTLKQWTLRDAESEFPIHRDTLSKRLAKLREKPDTDGFYTTGQICAAVYGDSEAEKLRKLKAEADLAEMERDERGRSLIPADIVEGVWQNVLSGLKAIVTSADIPKDLRHRLLEQMKSIPLDDYTEAAVPADDADSEAES